MNEIEIVNLRLRLPVKLHQSITENAKREHRSMQSLVLVTLEKAFSRESSIEQKPSTQEKAPDEATSEAKSNH